jgi:hypothetical protein
MLDTSKAQVQLLCQQAKDRAGASLAWHAIDCGVIGLYSAESLKEKGWEGVEQERWKTMLAAREAVYEVQLENYWSTCTHGPSGRERRPIVEAEVLAEFNPEMPAPGEKANRHKRTSHFSRLATAARKKQKKQQKAGDRSSSTGIPARKNRM